MKTISFTVDDKIAEKIERDAEKNFMTVSQVMRKLVTEKYGLEEG